MMRRNNLFSGYLLISALILIILVGFVSITITYLLSTSFSKVNMQLASNRAFYLARSGAELTLYRILGISNLGSHLSCTQINGEPSLTNRSLFVDRWGNSQGQFTSTSELKQAVQGTLSANISASSLIIPIFYAYINQYSTLGNVMMDREVVSYGAISQDYTACQSNPPCLVGVTRGLNGTLPVAHSIYTPVTQKQCIIKTMASVPPSPNTIAHRTIVSPILQFEEGWLVGNNGLGQGLIAYWDGSYWTTYNPGFIMPPLNSFSSLSYGDAWAVGDADAAVNLIHWNGLQWSRFYPTPPASPLINLLGISCSSFNHCRAVGTGKLLLQWNGNQWIRDAFDDTDLPQLMLYSVDCYDPYNCWAVGIGDKKLKNNLEKGESIIIRWNSNTAQWQQDPYTYNLNLKGVLYGISCANNSECEVVGRGKNAPILLHWTSSYGWSELMAPNSTLSIKSVFCKPHAMGVADNCVAVGDNRAFLHLTGTVWSFDSVNTTDIPSTANFRSVHCNLVDCWAVSDSGVIAIKEKAFEVGSVWVGVTSKDAGVSSGILNSVATIKNKSQNRIPWQEEIIH